MNEVVNFGFGAFGVGASKYSPFMLGSVVGVMIVVAPQPTTKAKLSMLYIK